MFMKGNTAAGTCSFEERLMVMVKVGRCGEISWERNESQCLLGTDAWQCGGVGVSRERIDKLNMY